jgi:hypothetical protein
MNNFRSVDFWKESITTLPDNAFFELLRSVFGKIKTPYSKQTLAGDLEKFLLREDIQKNIACYIDDNDTRIIAAVAALNEPCLNDLEIFFAGDLNYAELHDLVVNLEERFILYRFFEKEKKQRSNQKSAKGHGPGRLALNPVLQSILSPLAADSSPLFPSLSIDEVSQDEITQNKNKILLDDRILAALLSFVSQNKLFFRMSGGSIRQKVLNAAETLFHDLPLETITGALQALGLLLAEDETLTPDYRRFAGFGALDRQGRMIYCAAGILSYHDFKEGAISKESASSRDGDAPAAFSPWLLRPRIHNYAEIINRLYSSIDTKRLYPPVTLRKLTYMLGRANAENADSAAGIGGAYAGITSAGVVNCEKIIKVMEETGLIVPVSDKYWYKAPLTESPAPDAAIAMDTPFTILLYPEIAYNDAITIAAFSDVVEAGMTVRFEMSRESVVSAFNRGLSADAIIELLQRLSHNRINENLSFTLNDWEKRHGEVTMRRGLVLTLAPEQRHLAETRSLARFITETLAPGVYMLPESAEDKVVQALHKAGVAIIARKGEAAENMLYDGEFSSVPLRSFFLPLHAAKIQTRSGETSRGLQKDSPASILTESFHSILNKTRPKGEERDELAARIDRRLVLCESQLKDAVVRYEKLEARGMDYVGKSLIAKQAISLQTPVEVIWPGKNKQERVFGIPKALDKADSESILIIDPLNDEDLVRVPLGKISLLRRKRKSIFEE